MKIIIHKSQINLVIGPAEPDPSKNLDLIQIDGEMINIACPLGSAAVIRPAGNATWFLHSTSGPFIMDEAYISAVLSEVEEGMGEKEWENATVKRDIPLIIHK